MMCLNLRSKKGNFALLRAAFLAVFLILSSVGVSFAQEKEETESASDPLESWNRTVFGFNEVIDAVALKPAAQVYRGVVPEYGRERVSNVLRNMRMPVVALNSFLQGDPGNAFSAFWSFMLNSTLGIAGLFDFADVNTDLKVRNEDFGQTLGAWGVGPNGYIVLPLIGPSSSRDAVGLVADIFSDPFNYMDDDVVVTSTVAAAIDRRAANIELIDEIYKDSFDPYATIRSLYLQRRESEVQNSTKTNN